MIAITDTNFPSVDERLEQFKTWQDRLPIYLKRGTPNPKDNIIAVRTRYSQDGKKIEKEWFYGHNIVTDVGDTFYAEQAVNASLTEDFLTSDNRCELQNPTVADTPAKSDTYDDVSDPITASRKAITGTYPKVSDPDANNTGGGVDIASWDYAWTISDFNTESANDITGGVIHNGGTTPISSTPLLTHYNFTTPFEKLSTDTLDVFHNHRFNGV